jgi:hypothetical protein
MPAMVAWYAHASGAAASLLFSAWRCAAAKAHLWRQATRLLREQALLWYSRMSLAFHRKVFAGTTAPSWRHFLPTGTWRLGSSSVPQRV